MILERPWASDVVWYWVGHLVHPMGANTGMAATSDGAWYWSGREDPMYHDTGWAIWCIGWVLILEWLLHLMVHDTGAAVSIPCTMILGWPSGASDGCWYWDGHYISWCIILCGLKLSHNNALTVGFIYSWHPNQSVIECYVHHAECRKFNLLPGGAALQTW
jgi:hypothetical protein